MSENIAETGKVYPAGMKWTKQRKRVYDILQRAGEPVSAAWIYQELVREGETSGYAVSTIYRILNAFEEKELVIKETRPQEDNAVYELNRGGHTHYALCLGCHKRIPLHVCPFEHLHLDAGEADFVITGHKLELYGYCRECSR